mmetsp:Transcript_15583/g.42304  ORF Transcript_15583/g.42304 Transcript_15583/m.42304 type:complete len:255 (+) Transcript_15583:263-1027(+)
MRTCTTLRTHADHVATAAAVIAVAAAGGSAELTGRNVARHRGTAEIRAARRRCGCRSRGLEGRGGGSMRQDAGHGGLPGRGEHVGSALLVARVVPIRGRHEASQDGLLFYAASCCIATLCRKVCLAIVTQLHAEGHGLIVHKHLHNAILVTEVGILAKAHIERAALVSLVWLLYDHDIHSSSQMRCNCIDTAQQGTASIEDRALYGPGSPGWIPVKRGWRWQQGLCRSLCCRQLLISTHPCSIEHLHNGSFTTA